MLVRYGWVVWEALVQDEAVVSYHLTVVLNVENTTPHEIHTQTGDTVMLVELKQ